MDATGELQATAMRNRSKVERTSERELIVRRTFDAPARIVFEAWTKPELFKQWWVPKSMSAFMSLLSCEMDVRAGGKYRFVFGMNGNEMEVFGTYIEVTPPSRLVWTNEEGDEGGAVTTLTLEEEGGQTLLVKHDLYPSKAALDAEVASGATEGMPEQLEQLDGLLVTLGASDGRS
jgi:uncharacterized protein YndB with AHSA1/START domain